MNISSIVNGIRRLGHLIIGIFPWAARMGLRSQRMIGAFLTSPAVAPLWNRLIDSRQGQALLNVIQRFWWRDYSKERVDATPVPVAVASILRPTITLGVVLALLAPVALYLPGKVEVHSQVIEMLGTAPGWSLVLWVLALAFAWGGMLTGGVTANRISSPVAILLFLLFMAYFSGVAPLSIWNLLVPGIAVVAAALSYGRLGRPSALGTLLGAVSCGTVGVFCGFLAMGMIPLDSRPLWLKITLGLGLGALAFGWGHLARSPGRESLVFRNPKTHHIFHVFSASVLLFLVSVWLRADLGSVGGSIVDAQSLWTGYLWPVWYLLGTGIVYKLLKHAQVLTTSIKDIVPHKLLIPIVVLFFAATTIVLWSEWVLNSPAFGWPVWFYSAMAKVYSATYGLIWSEFIYALSASIMRWVMLFVLMAAAWLAICRRLTTSSAATLLFQTFLAWFACTQYYLNIAGFARGGEPSLLAVLAVAVMILWLVTRIGLGLAMRSSEWWPSEARITIFAGILLLLLLELHCHAALHDAATLDRIFFFMFRGVLEFGLPYFLLVYAGRRLGGDLPLPVPRLIGAFAVGAVAAMGFNAADKLVAVGGRPAALWADLEARLSTVLSGDLAGLADMIPQLPPAWLVVRGLAAVSLMMLVAWWSRRKLIDKPNGPAGMIFAIVGVATGLASFAQARVEIPFITPFWALLFEPARWSNELDANIFALYLAHWIPALLIALVVTRRGRLRPLAWIGAALGASVVMITANLVWPASEAWLHASGMLYVCGFAAAGVVVLLIRAAGLRIESSLPVDKPEPEAPAAPEPVLGPRSLAILCTLALVVLALISYQQVRDNRVERRELAESSLKPGLPAAWKIPADAPPGVVVFARDSDSGERTLLFLDPRPPGSGELDAVITQTLAAAPSLFPDFELLGPTESWARFHPNAVIQDFLYSRQRPDYPSEAMMGSVLFLDLDDGSVLVTTLVGSTLDLPRRRWDLAVLAKSLGEMR